MSEASPSTQEVMPPEFDGPRRSLDHMAWGISHELNNLLQIIRGCTSCVRSTLAPGSESEEDLQQVLAAVDQSARLTQRMVEFINEGQGTTGKRTDINHLMAELPSALRSSLPVGGNLRVIPRSTPAWAVGQEEALRQALFCLCKNAIESLGPEGEVVVRVEQFTAPDFLDVGGSSLKAGSYLRLWVTDNGRGIEPDNLTHLFKPFYSTKKSEHGMGLGLTLVRSVAEQLGGAVTVCSEPGIGTTLVLYLPTGDESHTLPCNMGAEPSRTLLFLGTDPWAVEPYCEALRHSGWSVMTASSIEDVLPGIPIDAIVVFEPVSDAEARQLACHYVVPEGGLLRASPWGPQSVITSSMGGLPRISWPADLSELRTVVTSLEQQSESSRGGLLPSDPIIPSAHGGISC